MLAASLSANVALMIGIVIILAAARRAILREKAATYAGCIASISEGLCFPDADRRVDAISLGLARMRPGGTPDRDQDELRTSLLRAGLLRMYRPAALADVGEHLRKLALDSAPPGQETALDVCDYLAQPGHDEAGRVIEPVEKFGGEVIATGQMQIERDIVAEYGRRVRATTIKLFGA